MKFNFFLTIFLFLYIFNLDADIFGKNKVQQEKINWSIIESRHFDIYFVKEHEELGKLALLIAENAYINKNQFFRHPLGNRIPIIVFSSKQEFQTTNIIYPLLPEGVGGFTETLRNRVALPFDGSYKKFEEVLIHELVHAYENDLEGTFFRNPTIRTFTSNLPFWFSEGLPEYLALKGSDVYNEKFIIDMVVNDQIRDMEYLGGFFAYRLGEALLVWISEEYDDNKVAEYFYNARLHPDIQTSTKMTFGFDFTELQEKFRLHLKRKYSNLIVEMNTPWEVATQHTHARNTNNFENVFPRFSPDGNSFVFFSAHKARTSILKGSTLQLNKDEVVLVGERSARFEEFHHSRNNITWFPEGFTDNKGNVSKNAIAFVAKTTFGDVIYFYDIDSKNVIDELSFEQFDSIYEIDISPTGDFIAITAQKDNRCDLYLYDIYDKELTQITDDNYFVYNPNWSKDGTKIAFVSERPMADIDLPLTNIISYPRIFHQFVENIYYLDLISNEIYQITDDTFNNYFPIWIDNNKLAFITQKTGIANIDLIDIENNKRATFTNILTGMHSFDYSDKNNMILFSVYFNNAYDIFSKSLYFDDLIFEDYNTMKRVEFDNDFHFNFRTDRYRFYGRYRNEVASVQAFITNDEDEYIQTDSESGSIHGFTSDYSLATNISSFIQRPHTPNLLPDTLNYSNPVIKNYRPKFQIDSFWGGFAYSPSHGGVGMLQLGLSDIMGDHGIGISMDFNGHFEESNIIMSYMYLPHRIDYGVAAFNYADYFLTRDLLTRIYYEYREYETGIYLLTRYPFSRFFRMDLDHSFYRYRLELHRWNSLTGLWSQLYSDSDYIYLPQLRFVFDNSLWGSTGPMAGTRTALVLRHSFSLNNKDNSFSTIYADLRHYYLISNRFAFANRLFMGYSEGDRPEMFDLTGFSGVRGFNDRNFRGNRKIAGSSELRVPLIDFLRFGFPLPITITNVRGSFFADLGTVWNKDDFRGAKDGGLNDLKMGFGFGPRLNLGFFVLRLDMAWSTDFISTSKPSFYLLLSEDF